MTGSEKETDAAGRVNERRLSPTRNIIAGSIGGMVGWIAGQPLDIVKVRLQTQSHTNPIYKGPLDCLLKIIKTEGFTALYRGMLAPVLMAAPASALGFFSLSLGKRLQLERPDMEPTMLQYVNAGVFAGISIALVLGPAERLKCLLQVDRSSGGAHKYTNTYDCFKKVMKESGFRGVTRGLGVTFVREMVGNGAWYTTYEGLLHLSRRDGRTRDDVGTLTIALAGGAAGIAFWGTIFPVDVLKTRLQVAPLEQYPNGARGILMNVLKTEGLRALYRGYVPALLRAVVVHASLFVGYESSMKTMNHFFP